MNELTIAEPINTIRIDSEPKKPDIITETQTNLEQAVRTGQWAVFVIRVENGNVYLERTAQNVPQSDIPVALRLIADDCQKLKGEVVPNA
jgi:hypothetical protein